MKILITDGLHQKGILMLEEEGFTVVEKSLSADDLEQTLPDYDGIIIRSATNLRETLLSKCPQLKFIGRGGVGMDNIDVEYARAKRIEVFNTPAASSRSVAELVFGHIIAIARGLHQSNREMPVIGNSNFKQLKKRYSKGLELSGKTLGIIGLGRIGTESARIGLGMGMKVISFDPEVEEKKIGIDINGQQVYTVLRTSSFMEVLQNSDIISLHVPNQKEPIIGDQEIEIMKEGIIIVNASRGGIIDEGALLRGLDSGKIAGAGLDVFINEPEPDVRILNHPGISLTPHIGAATYQAQEKIAVELSQRIIGLYKERLKELS